MSLPTLRFFCETDEQSDVGALALAYADAFVAMRLPTRIIPVRVAFNGLEESRWDRHRELFMTPLVGGFVNVVCGTADHWKKFYTVGVRNILIADPGVVEREEWGGGSVASLYDAVITPETSTADILIAVGARVSVVPLDLITKAKALTDALYAA